MLDYKNLDLDEWRREVCKAIKELHYHLNANNNAM